MKIVGAIRRFFALWPKDRSPEGGGIRVCAKLSEKFLVQKLIAQELGLSHSESRLQSKGIFREFGLVYFLKILSIYL